MSETPHEIEGVPAAVSGMTPGHTHCANCGALLQGPWCHQCGQSTRHILKHLPALTADAAESLFGIDGRLVHTLPALYFRPGFLVREYFLGRRARYIAPFRLMFFMSVLAFLMIQLALNLSQALLEFDGPMVGRESTPEEVRADVTSALARIASARQTPDLPAVGQLALGLAAHTAAERANQRLRQLHATPLPAASVPAAPSTTAAAKRLEAIVHAPSDAAARDRAAAFSRSIAQGVERIGQSSPVARDWLGDLDKAVTDARQRGMARRASVAGAGAAAAPGPAVVAVPDIDVGTVSPQQPFRVHPTQVHATWLPGFVQDLINASTRQAAANLQAVATGTDESRKQARRRMIGNILAVAPQTLFVLIPVLALLLKLLYVFKSRLYIEHLIVALYSHAFIFLTLLLSVLLGLITSRLPAAAHTPAGWLQAALWIWLPVYLLLMQKRVYAQGWFLTVTKYGCTAICYGILLSFAVAITAVVGLAR